jgi:hypothetical protein
MPTSAEIERMDVATATQRVATASRIDTARIVYEVDGKEASKADVMQLAPGQIGAIEVRRGLGDSGRVIIRKKMDGEIIEGRRIAVGGDSAPKVLVRTRQAGGDSVAVFVGGVPFSRDGRFDMRDTTTRPVVIVDGVEVPERTLRDLAADRIASVEVIKGQAAAVRYPNTKGASNGVIVVTLKK